MLERTGLPSGCCAASAGLTSGTDVGTRGSRLAHDALGPCQHTAQAVGCVSGLPHSQAGFYFGKGKCGVVHLMYNASCGSCTGRRCILFGVRHSPDTCMQGPWSMGVGALSFWPEHLLQEPSHAGVHLPVRLAGCRWQLPGSAALPAQAEVQVWVQVACTGIGHSYRCAH